MMYRADVGELGAAVARLDEATRTSEPLSGTRASCDATGEPSAASALRRRDPARYLILGEHGRGGAGCVYRAHDRELGRDVAIKQLLSRGGVNEVRFLREALITARLDHPGIVPIYDAGRWPDGTPFYAMKLVSGYTLRVLLAERTTADQRLGLFDHIIAVADAIGYAHRRNIIHRDLKPANIVVDDTGQAVVIDWGLAKDLSATDDPPSITGSAPPSDTDLTATGSILGTPTYMAPEQELGERVDKRADVFSLGAMLWELSAQPRIPPANAHRRRELLHGAGVQRALIAIIDKALADNPVDRYADAAALAAALKEFRAATRGCAPALHNRWAALASHRRQPRIANRRTRRGKRSVRVVRRIFRGKNAPRARLCKQATT